MNIFVMVVGVKSRKQVLSVKGVVSVFTIQWERCMSEQNVSSHSRNVVRNVPHKREFAISVGKKFFLISSKMEFVNFAGIQCHALLAENGCVRNT